MAADGFQLRSGAQELVGKGCGEGLVARDGLLLQGPALQAGQIGSLSPLRRRNGLQGA